MCISSPPRDVSVTNITNSTVSLEVEDPQPVNGSNLTSYEIQISLPNDTYTPVNATDNTNEQSNTAGRYGMLSCII